MSPVYFTCVAFPLLREMLERMATKVIQAKRYSIMKYERGCVGQEYYIYMKLGDFERV